MILIMFYCFYLSAVFMQNASYIRIKSILIKWNQDFKDMWCISYIKINPVIIDFVIENSKTIEVHSSLRNLKQNNT